MPATPDDGSGRLDVDAAFAEIVARWRDDEVGAQQESSGRTAPTQDEARGDALSVEDGDAARQADANEPEGSDPGTPSPQNPASGSWLPENQRPDTQRPDTQRPDTQRTVRPARPLPPPPREAVLPPPIGFDAAAHRPVDPARPEQFRADHVRAEAARNDAARREALRDKAEANAAAEEDRFIPADPTPLPRDLVTWGAWLAVAGAPMFLLVVALVWRSVPSLVTAVTAAVFVGGFATLVMRLPSSRDDDEDDGAVV